MWKLFSINKKETLVEILNRYTEAEVREAIPKAFKGCHFSNNPPKTAVRKEKSVAYDVLVNGERLASTTGSDTDAKKEAEHYALMYVDDGKVEIRKKTRKSFVKAGCFI